MSNFLQRVASSVLRPQVKLQPIQGSVFVPTDLRRSAEPFSEQAEAARPSAAVSDFSGHFHIAHEADRASNPTVGEDRSLDSTASRYATRNQTDAQGADIPLLPLPLERETAVSGRSAGIRPPADAQESKRDGVASESLELPVANRPMTSDQYQALLITRQAALAPIQPRQVASSPQASAKSTASRVAPSAQREADEIHIHIGRIEVAAIAQAAPRPPAAPARKTVNLEEYLRRGDGRAG